MKLRARIKPQFLRDIVSGDKTREYREIESIQLTCDPETTAYGDKDLRPRRSEECVDCDVYLENRDWDSDDAEDAPIFAAPCRFTFHVQDAHGVYGDQLPEEIQSIGILQGISPEDAVRRYYSDVPWTGSPMITLELGEEVDP